MDNNPLKFMLHFTFVVAIGLALTNQLISPKAPVQLSASSLALIQPAAGNSDADRMARLAREVAAAKKKTATVDAVRAYANNN